MAKPDYAPETHADAVITIDEAKAAMKHALVLYQEVTGSPAAPSIVANMAATLMASLTIHNLTVDVDLTLLNVDSVNFALLGI